MGPCKVLFAVAEKDSATREAASYLENKLGCAVRFAYGGNICIDSVKSFKPTILVIDLFLPRADTYGICSEIKDNTNIEDIPIIALSIISPNKKFKNLRADVVLPRPFDAKSLVETILGVLNWEHDIDLPEDPSHGFWSVTV